MGAIVSDATCLIGLHHIGKLDLLPKLFSKVLIPPAVRHEVGFDIEKVDLLAPLDTNLANSLKLVLGAGESEAITLALELALPIVLDEKKARTIAEAMGLKILGTVGLLVLAKKQNLLQSVSSLLHDLEATGFYMSTSLKEQALQGAGERSI